MAKKQTDSVTSLVEMAANDVAALLEEMEEWQSNMEGANMDHLPKFEQVSECVDAIQNADLPNYVEFLVPLLEKADSLGMPFDDMIQHVVSTAKRQTRSDRMGEACGYLELALDAIEGRLEDYREANKISDDEAEAEEESPTEEGAAKQEKIDVLDEVESATQDVRNAWDELIGVEFPGAFGG